MTNPGFKPHRGHGYSARDNRYKYSPTLEDSAVCCVPNACKSYPFYVSHMWMKAPDGLVAVRYGHCTLTTEFRGVQIRIVEMTDYPFSDTIEFELHPAEAIELTFRLRNPQWSQGTKIECDGAKITENERFYLVTKIWHPGDRVTVRFDDTVHTRTAFDNSLHFQRGSLVYALNIPAEEKTLRNYPIPGFHDYIHTPTNQTFRDPRVVKQGDDWGFSFVEKGPVGENPWAMPPVALRGKMKQGDEMTEVELVPMGSTILRRVTFH